MSVKTGALSQSIAFNVVPVTTAKVALQDTYDWGAGFVGQITIANHGAAAINTWTLEFDFAGAIDPTFNTGIWNAKVVSHSGDHYVVKCVSWDAVIAAGQSVSFGFVAEWDSARTAPSSFILNGAAVPAA